MEDRQGFGSLTCSATDHTLFLSQQIGPRPPASVAEARAARYCFAVLEESGLHPRYEPFSGPESFGKIYILPMLGLLISALLGTLKRSPKLFAGGIGSTSLATIWGENSSRWRPLMKRISKAPSQNVVAVIPSTRQTRAKLVVTAHLDSSRSGWMFSSRRAERFRRDAIRALWGGLAGIWALVLPRILRRSVAAVSALTTGTALAMMLQSEIFGDNIEGANDNASGVAVALCVADALAEHPAEHTEVWVLLTGCEESDRVGMEAFLDRHEKNLEGAWFIGLDSVAGHGTDLRWITRSGLLDQFRADYLLTHLAQEVASGRPATGATSGVWRSGGLGTDAAAARGFNCMSLMSLTPSGALPNWRSPTDTLENLDLNKLSQCLDFTLALVRRFDAQT